MAGDHGVVFLFFVVVGCPFGVRVAVGFECSPWSQRIPIKTPSYLGFSMKHRLQFFFKINPTYLGFVYKKTVSS